MTPEEAQMWLEQLRRYRYAVNLADFQSHAQFGNNWFTANLTNGDWQETTQFENRFRQLAPTHLEAWYEVVFWKLYSMALVRNGTTQAVVNRTAQANPAYLWNTMLQYLENWESHCDFEALQANFFQGHPLPVVATFVSFADPERFPMVDTNVVDWVDEYLMMHHERIAGNTLQRRNHAGALTTTYDWDFYIGWVQWCRESAQILSQASGIHWRARDVEMAAFRNAQERVQGIPLLPPVY